MVLCALLACPIPPATAQPSDVPPLVADPGTPDAALQPGTTRLGTVVVRGIRSRLALEQEIRRNTLEIVDSIAAEEVARLPDFSVTDALQRIAGVQIARDRGEGANVAIRGLTQMETLLDGREVFTAGSGRNLDFADIPSELVSRIDVYKTAGADHVEGGIGGVVDLRTRRPFDFAGRTIVGSARLVHGDLVKKEKGQLSVLASNRWRTGVGEFGALVNLSLQERAWREDNKGTGNPVARTDLIDGQTVLAPAGTSETTSVGVRRRTAGHAVLQWRPSPALELYAEASHAEFRTIQDSHQINVQASSTFVPGSVTLFPGTQDLQRITWTQAPLSILSFARDTIDRTTQAAVGGSWTRGPLTVSADWSRTRSFNNLFFSGPFFAGTAASFTHDLSSGVPGTSVSGTGLLDPANLRVTGIAYRTRPFDGVLNAARADAELRLDGAVLQTLRFGVRQAQRGASNTPGLIFADASVTGLTAADRPAFVMPNPYTFFPGVGTPSLHDFIVGNLATARDAPALRDAFGITAPIPTSANPLSLWDIRERTRAAYLLAHVKAGRAPIDGSIGIRAVHTRESVSGSQSVPATGAVEPIHIDVDTTDWLPSVNLRLRVSDAWTLRASASRTLTRPNFDQLSPSLTLVPNPITPSLNQGGAGNPALRPIRSKNLDLAVERYIGPTTSIFVTGFVKKVDGFVTTVSSPEVHDGATYQVSRPQNSTPADIKGVELAYQQFYDQLPGWLNGFGLRANYTYIDSEMPLNAGGASLPLQNLSRHSVNLVGLYERGRTTVRVAYNWRDKFLSGVANIVNVGTLPIYTRGYGWLDASWRHRVSKSMSFAIEGTNLLRTMRSSHFGVETHPQGNWLNDRQLAFVVTFEL